MKQKMFNLKGAPLCALFLLVFFCGVIQLAQATNWLVTSANDTGEGSLQAAFNSMGNGDTVTIDRENVNEIIFSSVVQLSKTAKGNKYILIGNGVKIVNALISFGISQSAAADDVIFENFYFENAYIGTEYVRQTRFTNCHFTTTSDNLPHQYGCVLEMGMPNSMVSGENLFEGCMFEQTSKPLNMIVMDNANFQYISKLVRFVSCTFKNNLSGSALFKQQTSNPKLTTEFVNCVIIDPSGANSTPTIDSYSVISKGFNVIQGYIKTNTTNITAGEEYLGWAKQETDTILALNAEPPLINDEDIYKVRYAGGNGPAYLHLPASPGLLTPLANISFPKYDLSGNGIIYTKPSHSGAWQSVYYAEGETPPTEETVATGMSITPDQEIYTEQTLQLNVSVQPNNAEQDVEWTSSDDAIATVNENGLVSVLATTRTENVTVDITAITTKAKDAQGNSLSRTVTLTVKPYIHVSGINLDDSELTATPFVNGYSRTLRATVEPETALNPALVWTAEPTDIVGITTGNGNTAPTLKALKAGTATITATATDNGWTATCQVVVTRADYTDGMFVVNEDWFGQYNSSVNYLYPDGHWDIRTTTTINNKEILGTTTQFGIIYGGKFYFVSKQGKRLTVTDAKTLELQNTFLDTGGDGRSFIGVDEHTGYLGTASGIRVINLGEISDLPQENNTLPHTKIAGAESGAGQYSGQVGVMERVGNYVFAIQQGVGTLVINANSHQVEQVLTAYNYHSLTLAKDGYLYAGTTATASTGATGGEDGWVEETANIIVRIDPWTRTETPILLPGGVSGPPIMWGAWQCGPIWAATTENKIFWRTGGNKVIIRYNIDNNSVDTVLNLNGYKRHEITAADPWSFYGTSFRVQSGTDFLYGVVGTFDGISGNVAHRNHWKAIKIDHNGGQPHPDEEGITGNIVEEYPLPDNYWFPAMPVFPDKHRPAFVAANPFPETVTLGATHGTDSIGFGDKVYDADNLTASIVATIADDFNKSLVNAYIWRDTLVISARKIIPVGQPSESTVITLKFNSNGHVITKEIPVTVEPGALAHTVTGITLDRIAAKITIGQTLQLVPAVTPDGADNKTVKWASSDPAVATVSANGLVTALSTGAAAIIATTVDGGFTAFCNITAEPPIVLNPFGLNTHALTLDVGQIAQLSITAPEQYTVAWRSLDEAVAIVGSSGKVAASGTGTAKIIAEDIEKGKSDTCTVTVREKPVEYTVRLNHTTLVMNEGDRTAVTVTVSPAAGQQSVTWSSSNPAVADVTESGTVIAAAGGNAEITAQLAGGASATCSVSVRDLSAYAETGEVGTDRAILTFPRFSGAGYYLVHLFEISEDQRIPAVTYKVNPDGTVACYTVHLRSSQANISLALSGLKPSTAYEADIDVVREISGTDEAVSTLSVSFTTQGGETGIERTDALNAALRYSGGALQLRNLKGYTCHVASVTGQALKLFRVNNDEETFAVSLSPGIYILTAQKEGGRRTFKFIVH